MKIIRCEQGSQSWHLARRGIPTASNFDRIITAKTGKLSAQADDYIAELIADLADLMYPANAEHYTSRHMLNGQNTEAEARRWYSLERNVKVEKVGFVVRDDLKYGCSPDGLILGPDGKPMGGLELKCPLLKTHAKYLFHYQKTGLMPAEHRPQVHGGLATSDLPWWDFMSYPLGNLDALLIRVTPDEYTETLRKALDDFDVRFQEMLSKILPEQVRKVVAS